MYRYYAIKQYYYILCYLTIINILSKHAWAVSLQTKSGSEIARAIAKIIRDDRCPKNFQTDMGKKFYNANLQNLLKKHINHYSIMKTSIIEWFNYILTCGNSLRIMKIINGSSRIEYNARTVNMRPINVTLTIAELLITMYNRIKNYRICAIQSKRFDTRE